MIRATFIAAALLGGALVCPAQADSTVAYCMTSFHKLRRGPTPLRACHFAQYQGNAYIRLADGTRYQFSEKDQGDKHHRQATIDAIAFMIPDDRTINVIWPDDGISCSLEES